MHATSIIAVAVGLEVLTAGLLFVAPDVFARLLLGAGLADAGIAIGRLAGVSLLGLAVACWPSWTAEPQTRRPAFALVTFNLLCAVFLAFIGITEQTIGILLWPAAAAHGVLGALILSQLADRLGG